jgi:hypothetical protein
MRKIAHFRDIINFEVFEFVVVGNSLAWYWLDELGDGKYGDHITLSLLEGQEMNEDNLKDGMSILRKQILDLMVNGTKKDKEKLRLTIPLKNL